MNYIEKLKLAEKSLEEDKKRYDQEMEEFHAKLNSDPEFAQKVKTWSDSNESSDYPSFRRNPFLPREIINIDKERLLARTEELCNKYSVGLEVSESNLIATLSFPNNLIIYYALTTNKWRVKGDKKWVKSKNLHSILLKYKSNLI
ncbi:hypothetical protein H6G33_10130 [Calothrix sp. FACHB-1219]|uniref:hypothetical protein n=1 Tax=unclassified Calothrix TaxID=2619626 RepID=UPI001684E5AC|nr:MULTISPECIES: hypothetical protein [unclassified Calothrix]MBD2201705.1 hypothetical protein [Calothrix sp. FACHB-168]MBD2217391.1 hypothetical protein [Calothrix sp. FACHB-1219]